MNTADIRNLYAYNGWANRRIIGDAAALSQDELTRDLHASHVSVHGTLLHIMWGEWLWLRRFRGESPKQIFLPAGFPDLAALEEKWIEVERELEEFIRELTDERLAARVGYENFQGQRWEYSLLQMMQQVANHSSYHRGQVVTLLRQLGRTPRSTDLLVFIDERGGSSS